MKRGQSDVTDKISDKNEGEQQLSDTEQSNNSHPNHISLRKIERPQGTTQEAAKKGEDCYIAVKTRLQ